MARPRDVRRDDHVVQPQQRVVRPNRLGGHHVRRSGVHLARQQSIPQIRFVDEPAARGVEQNHAVFHLRQRGFVNHADVLRGLRAVQGHNVAAGVQFVQRHIAFARSVAAVINDIHTERAGEFRRRLTDAPIADDAERLARQLHQRIIPEGEVSASRPASLLHRVVMMADAVADFQQLRHHELRDRLRAIGRNICDNDALFLRRRNVNDVEARRQHTDVAQIRASIHRLAGNGRLIGEDNRRVADAGKNLLRRGVIIDSQVAQGGEGFPAQVAGILHSAVQNGDFHGCVPPAVVCFGSYYIAGCGRIARGFCGCAKQRRIYSRLLWGAPFQRFLGDPFKGKIQTGRGSEAFCAK